MRISDWSSDVCSSDLVRLPDHAPEIQFRVGREGEDHGRNHRLRRHVPDHHHTPPSCPRLAHAAPRTVRIVAGIPFHFLSALAEMTKYGHETFLHGSRRCSAGRGIWYSSRRLPSSNARTCPADSRSEEHTSDIQTLMRNSYAVFCLKK